MSGKSRPRIVVIGGGFGGLEAAKSLARLPVQITLVDRKNHHTFQPLLYQVATAGLVSGGNRRAHPRDFRQPQECRSPAGRGARRSTSSDRIVKLHGFELSYDYLVVAAGATHAYFGHDEWEPFAPGLKTIEDALEMRRRILLAYELAEREAALTGRHRPLNFVVVGGGPTGVELAGTLAEIARKSLSQNFRHIDPAKTRVLLVEAGPSRVERLSRRPAPERREAVATSRRRGASQLRRDRCAPGRSFRRQRYASRRRRVMGGGSLGVAAWPCSWAPRSIAPDECWSNLTSASPDIARCSSSATSPA